MLPSSKDQIKGLRVARWIRESTADQFDRYGPDSQREQQDRAIQRYELVDTGLVYQVAESGTTVWKSGEMARMLAEAGFEFDLILIGYFDRWQRNIRRTVELVEDRLHPAGAALFLCDKDLLSSSPTNWPDIRRLANEAEEYSERLGIRVGDGYAEKFKRYADQAGNAPLGFRREAVKPFLMEIDPANIQQVVHLYERYSTGTVSIRDLVAETGLEYERINKVLRSPLYNGWVRRHRGQNEERLPAGWRVDPPVSDELWNRVADQRRNRTHAGGKRSDRIDPLTGLIFCTCGVRVPSNGLMGTPAKPSRMHFQPCADWGKQIHYASAVWEEPIFAQMAGIDLSDHTIERVVRILSKNNPSPISLDKARNGRRKRQLALEYAAGATTLEDFTAGNKAMSDAGTASPAVRGGVDPAKAIQYLENIPLLLARATPAERAELIHGIYERIEVNGPAFFGVTLTRSAYAAGLALSLPESVSRNWRPRKCLSPGHR